MSLALGDIRLLHVDDEPEVAELAAEYLKREDDRLAVKTTTSASEGMDLIDEHDYDCIVADYDMPGLDGIEFLEAIREEYPDLPFILYTGKGSEEVASEAISAGVTDYLQKKRGTEQYELLANRIQNAVVRHQTQRELDQEQAESAQLLEWLDHALTTTNTYVWEWDLQSDEIQRHPTTEPLIGIKSEAIGGVHEGWIDYVHPDDRSAIEQTITEGIESGEGYQVICRVETGDGSWRWVRDQAKVETEDGEVIRAVGSVTDITALTERKQELEQYRTLVETVGDPMYMLDADGVITMVNEAAIEYWGYDREEIVGTHLKEIMPDEDYERGTDLIVDLLTTDGAQWRTNVMRSFTSDGETVVNENKIGILTDDGELLGSVGVVRDISERERFQTFIEQSTDIVSVLDANGIYQYQSPSSKRITGYKPEELMGDNAFEYIHPEDRPRVMEKFYEAAENPVLNPQAEYRFQRNDGSWLWLESRGNYQFDNPAIDGFVVNTRNVTERKDREEALERQNERLDEFASVVSHDLRNPLNVAEGRLDLAGQDCESEHIDYVAQALDRMEALIDDLLSLARAGETVGEMDTVELACLAEVCWQYVETASATFVANTETTFQADKTRLQQLLGNLLRNAVEHGGEDVTITIGDLSDGFYVEDDGPGIAEEERGSILDAGYSTAEEGTGFGLSIVWEIAEAHGWEVSMTDNKAGGARFEITDVEVTDS